MTARRNNFSARGFTLMELVLVMLVMAIVAAFAAPNLRNFISGRHATDAASEILALATWARSQAISEGRMYQLNVDPSAGTVSVSAEDDTGAMQPVESTVVDPVVLPTGTGAVRMDTDLPAGDNGIPAAKFYPTGRVDPGSIHLTDDHNNVITITSDSASENYHIVEGK